MQDLNEFLAAPVGAGKLEVVGRLDNRELYSSDKLRAKYVAAMAVCDKTKKDIDLINKLVMDKTIIPAFLTKNLLGFVKFKIFGSAGEKGIMGFFSPDVQKIFILIENAILDGMISAKEDFMASITIHECMHFGCNRGKANFIKLWMPELSKFYEAYYRDIFNVDKSKTFKVDKLILQKWTLFEKSGLNFTNSDLKKYNDTLISTFKNITTLDKEQFQTIVRDLLLTIKLYSVNIDAYLRLANSYKHIWSPLYNAYDKAFGIRNAQTLCVQELMWVSEVIAIIVEYKRYPKTRKTLQFLT